MSKYTKYNEEVNNKKSNYYVVLIIASIYLIYALFIYFLRTKFELNAYVVTISVIILTLLLKIVLFYLKLNIMYTYNKTLFFTVLILTYVSLPLFIFEQINYFNLRIYINEYLTFISENNFLNVLIINVNLLILAFILNSQYKNKSTILYEDNQIKLIEQTDVYVKTFDSKSKLDNYLLKLETDEQNNILPLKDFKKTKINNIAQQSYFLTLQLINFNDSNIKKVKVTKKIKFNKLETIALYKDALQF